MGNLLHTISSPIFQFYENWVMRWFSPRQSVDMIQFFDLEKRLGMKPNDYYCDFLSGFWIYENQPGIKEERKMFQAKLKKFFDKKNQNLEAFTPQESRALATLIGMAIGDALGAPMEFSRVTYNSIRLTGFHDKEYWNQKGFNRFRLKPGQWTDDTSMGLCLADSLLVCHGFDPIDLRIRFLNWWDFGYNNAFHYDRKAQPHSIGLGATIGSSFTEFKVNRSAFTVSGSREASGNGSIMRLAAVPIFYANDYDNGLEIAAKQSKTTHQGDEAAECCRLMTHIIISLINSSHETAKDRKEEILGKLSSSFQTQADYPVPSVESLARSESETKTRGDQQVPDPDRNWNWRSSDYKFSPTRASSQPGYIGSYAMDGLAMALHCVWSTESFSDAVIKAINLGGDADTVGAITGQIAGSLYGLELVPFDWISTVQRWDKNDMLFTAWKLYHQE